MSAAGKEIATVNNCAMKTTPVKRIIISGLYELLAHKILLHFSLPSIRNTYIICS